MTWYRTELKERGNLVFEAPPTHMFELGRFRDDTMAVRTKVHDMLVQKKTKDEIWAMLQRDHKWNQFQQRTVDGLMIELQ